MNNSIESKCKTPLRGSDNKIKLAIVGSRCITDFELLDHYGLAALSMMNISPWDIEQVISGGADGVDKLAERLCKKYKQFLGKPDIIRPDYKRQPPKIAPLLRNQTIVNECDAALVIWDRISGGTYDTLKRLHEARKPYILINVFMRHGSERLGTKTECLMTTIDFNTVPRWKELYETKIHPKRNSRRCGTSL